ncbi:MAG: hypothetical protein IIB54_14055 [Planctomycetes bacterium]|nr:hypothetical protein [Planctomycetota bacterium]
MVVTGKPLGQFCTARTRPAAGTALDSHISGALDSEPVAMQRNLLERIGRHLEAEPMLSKMVSESMLSLYFSVKGVSDEIREGTVVALEVLYDTHAKCAEYAHPVFAGPQISPEMKRRDQCPVRPRAQEGVNGELAEQRFAGHRRALWMQFEEDRLTLGRAEASRRWRDNFHWALVRLYFCCRCDGCQWGSPFFDGKRDEPYRGEGPVCEQEIKTPLEVRYIAEAITRSHAWKQETAWVGQAGIELDAVPCILVHLDQRYVAAVFPAKEKFVDDGVIVGMLVYFDKSMERLRYLHTLHAGPETEMPLMHGNRELGLPALGSEPQLHEAKDDYRAWRDVAWRQFWRDEFEFGVYKASCHWLDEFWPTLERFLRFSERNGSYHAPVTDFKSTSAMSS